MKAEDLLAHPLLSLVILLVSAIMLYIIVKMAKQLHSSLFKKPVPAVNTSSAKKKAKRRKSKRRNSLKKAGSGSSAKSLATPSNIIKEEKDVTGYIDPMEHNNESGDDSDADNEFPMEISSKYRPLVDKIVTKFQEYVSDESIWELLTEKERTKVNCICIKRFLCQAASV